MQLSVTYEPEVDAWFIRGKHVFLRTARDVALWQQSILEKLARLGGQRAYLLFDMNGTDIDMRIKESYGEAAHSIEERYALGVVRYGRMAGFTSTVLLLEGAKRGNSAKVLPDRASALAALAQMRDQNKQEQEQEQEQEQPPAHGNEAGT